MLFKNSKVTVRLDQITLIGEIEDHFDNAHAFSFKIYLPHTINIVWFVTKVLAEKTRDDLIKTWEKYLKELI